MCNWKDASLLMSKARSRTDFDSGFANPPVPVYIIQLHASLPWCSEKILKLFVQYFVYPFGVSGEDTVFLEEWDYHVDHGDYIFGKLKKKILDLT